MKLSLALCGVILVAFVGVVTSSLSAKDKTNINTGLTLAAKLSDFVTAKDFTNTLTELSKAIGPYLGAIGPLVGLIVGLFGTQESKEMHFLRDMLKHIDTRFDRIDGQFADVNRKIDFSHIRINFGQIEQKILAVSSEFKKLYNMPSSAAKHQKNLFISNYDSDYQNSGQKLYDGIMNDNHVYSASLGEAAMQYTQNDRGAVRAFMLGNLKLLLQAAKLELAYLKAKGYTSNYDFTKKSWISKIGHVKSKMIAIDKAVASKVYTQSTSDVERFSADHANYKTSDFANGLYHQLTAKFFWRDWMVVVYDDITGGDKHWMHECGGVVKYRNHGKNIVVASVDKSKHAMDHSKASHIVTATPTRKLLHRHGGKRDTEKRLLSTYYRAIEAHDIYNSFPSEVRDHCSPYASVGVIKLGSHQEYRGPSNRLIHVERPYYTLHIFG